MVDIVTSDDSVFVQKLQNVMEMPKDDLQQLLRLHKFILTKLLLEEE